MLTRTKLAAALVLALATSAAAQTCTTLRQRTVGTLADDPTGFGGYTLFAPIRDTTTYLIDHDGRLVHSWPSAYQPGNSVRLLDDGSILHTAALGPAINPTFTTGGAGGRLERIDWDGTLLWSFNYSSPLHLQHHDAVNMPNGHVLFIAWEKKTQAEAVAAGRNPALLRDGSLWPDSVLEVDPATNTIAWEWHLFDHVVQDFDATKANYAPVAQHPELVDLNFTRTPGADWTHVNSVDYSASLDQVMISVHDLNEIWIIDHGTTTAEARSHAGGLRGRGGDLLYRWGNPQVYRAGTRADQKLNGQHDAHWIEPGLAGGGHILVFDNLVPGQATQYSSVLELVPPLQPDGTYGLVAGTATAPAGPTWSYVATPPTSFYATHISGAQRLPNGNTFICHGPDGIFFEVDPTGQTLWTYVNPVVAAGPLAQGDAIPSGVNGRENSVFRAYRYAADHPGLLGRTLTPGDFVELYPDPPAAPIVDLRVTRPAGEVRLSWTPATLDTEGGIVSIDHYRVYRDLAPRAVSTLRGQPLSASYTDVGAATSGANYFYLVTSVNAACWESD